MKYTWPVIALLVTLAFGYCYGNERAASARSEERERSLLAAAELANHRAESAATSYRQARLRASAAEARVPAFVASRGRAVASTDSAVARVDSLLPTLQDSVQSIVRSLTAAFRVERLKSDSVILSLERTVALQDSALSAADSVISAQASVIAAQVALVRELQKRAHPSLFAAGRKGLIVGGVSAGCGVVGFAAGGPLGALAGTAVCSVVAGVAVR